MAGITPDIESTGIEELKGFLKTLADGNEGQQRLLRHGLLSTGRAAIEGADNPGLKDMTDLTAAVLANLLLSPDQADRVLAVKLYGPVYEEARKAKQTTAQLAEFYRRVGFPPNQG